MNISLSTIADKRSKKKQKTSEELSDEYLELCEVLASEPVTGAWAVNLSLHNSGLFQYFEVLADR
jgi:hypothetical protein